MSIYKLHNQFTMKLKLNFLFCISMLLFSSFAVLGQDILIKKNGDEFQCKVLELGPEKITYLYKNANDSASFDTLRLLKSEVFMIRYANGSKDVFETAAPVSTPSEYVQSSSELQVPESEKIEIHGRRFYYQNRPIGKNRVMRLMRAEKNKDINAYIAKSIACSVFSPILKFASIPAGVVGFIILGIGTNDNAAFNETELDKGRALVAGFFLAQVGGYTVEYFQYRNLKNAVKLYNTKHP